MITSTTARAAGPAPAMVAARARLWLVALLFVLAATIALAACGSSEETNTTSATTATRPGDKPESASMGGKVPTIVVRSGEPVGGIKQLEYNAGDEIRFEVSSDAAEEIHVHGYDLEKEVVPGKATSFSFPATIDGIFEIELHSTDDQIAELRVDP